MCDCRSHNGFLTAKGLKETEQRRGDTADFRAVDGSQSSLYIDTRVSVSGLRRDETHWDYDLLDQQYRRFLNELEVGYVISKES